MRKMIFYLSAFFFCYQACNPQEEVIRIATKPMTEQFILGEMLACLIQNETDLKVKIFKGIGGGTSNIHPAMLKGEFDLYPEYTGTGWLVVLKKDSLLPSEQLYQAVSDEYRQKYDFIWSKPYGFNNTYSLATPLHIAGQYHLKNFSDLAEFPDQFRFGAEYDFFEIHEGYDAMCEFYNLKFKKTTDMDIGLKYEAIKSGKIDIMNIFTTDGQLNGAGLTVLEDDKHFFPSYFCCTVVRGETLRKYPELEKILSRMDNILTNSEMSELNYQVDIAGKSEKEVAEHFLRKKGLIH